MLRGLSRQSDLIGSFQVASGPEATPFTSSALQTAILFCKTIRMKDAAFCSWCRKQHKAVKHVCWKKCE